MSETVFSPLGLAITAPMSGSFVSESSTMPDTMFCAIAPQNRVARVQSIIALLKVIMNTNNISNVNKVSKLLQLRVFGNT